MKNKKKHTQATDLVSTGVEEVAQADYVAVVQLPHDLQLAVLNKTKTLDDTLHISFMLHLSFMLIIQEVSPWTFWRP